MSEHLNLTLRPRAPLSTKPCLVAYVVGSAVENLTNARDIQLTQLGSPQNLFASHGNTSDHAGLPEIEKIISYGEIFVPKGFIEQDPEQEKQNTQDKLQIQAIKERIASGSYDKATTSQAHKEIRIIEAGMFRRRFPNDNDNYHTGLSIIQAPFSQNEDASAEIEFHLNPDYKSYIKIKHEFNYIDKVRPRIQPLHQVEICLTHRNLRNAGDIVLNEDLKGHQCMESYHVIDVSDRAWKDTLEKLYAHAIDKEPKYFHGLYNTVEEGYGLYIVIA